MNLIRLLAPRRSYLLSSSTCIGLGVSQMLRAHVARNDLRVRDNPLTFNTVEVRAGCSVHGLWAMLQQSVKMLYPVGADSHHHLRCPPQYRLRNERQHKVLNAPDQRRGGTANHPALQFGKVVEETA